MTPQEHSAYLKGWKEGIEAAANEMWHRKQFASAKIIRSLLPPSDGTPARENVEDLPEVKFVRHIESHLDMGTQEVVCKICNKTLLEIARGNSEPKSTEKGEGR